jgi:hypothetical protein
MLPSRHTVYPSPYPAATTETHPETPRAGANSPLVPPSRRRSLLLAVTLLSLSVAGGMHGAGLSATEPPDGFVPLFDGQTFHGWEGNLDHFRIEDGAIVGGNLHSPIPRNEFLCTPREYADFELRLKFRLRGTGANGGVQLRSRRIPDHHEMIGYQADMGEGWWGCLYDESRRNRVLAGPPEAERSGLIRPDDWNDYRIVCQGRRIRLWVNGHPTVDYTEADESLEQIGLIGLQIHSGPPAETWYKDLYLRELGTKEPNSP